MTATAETPPTSRSRIWRSGSIWAGATVMANLVLFAAARAADVSFLVQRTSDADPTRVTAVHVALMTLVPLVLGLAIALVAVRRLPRGLPIVRILGAAVALVSVAGPLSIEADTAAKLVLAAMHLTTGVAFVVALGHAREA